MILQKTEKLMATYWPSKKCIAVTVLGLPTSTKAAKGIAVDTEDPFCKRVFKNIPNVEVARDLNAIGKFERLVSQGDVTDKYGKYKLVFRDGIYGWEPIEKTPVAKVEPGKTDVWERIATSLERIADYVTGQIGGAI